MENNWRVVRHGGKLSDRWIEIHTGASEAEATKVYHKTLRSIRQGGLKLLQGEEEILMVNIPRSRFVFPIKKS